MIDVMMMMMANSLTKNLSATKPSFLLLKCVLCCHLNTFFIGKIIQELRFDLIHCSVHILTQVSALPLV